MTSSPGSDAEPAQDQLDRVGAVGDADALGGLAVLRVLGFERGDVRAADEAVGGGDLGPRLVELVGDLGVLAGEVEEGDPVGGGGGHATTSARDSRLHSQAPWYAAPSIPPFHG